MAESPTNSTNDRQNIGKVMEPLLLEDTVDQNLPSNAVDIINSLYESRLTVVSAGDIAVAFTYICMLETGFVPVDMMIQPIAALGFHAENLRKYKQLPPSWKINNSYSINFMLPNCPEMVLKLMAHLSEATLLMNIVNSTITLGYSCCLQPSRYVIQKAVNSPGDNFYQNLKEFTVKVKTSLCSPSRSAIFHHYNIMHASLIGLPSEVLFEILCLLSAPTLCRLAQTCSVLRHETSNSRLWEILHQRDFPGDFLDGEDLVWKSSYARYYKQRIKQILLKQRSDQLRLVRLREIAWCYGIPEFD